VWSDAGSVIGWIISVGAVITSGLAVMFYGTMKVQRDHITALEGRAATREQLLADALADKLKAETAAEVLRNTVTGEAHLVVIEGKCDDITHGLSSHHAEAMEGVQQVIELLTRLANQGDA
jgi:hypothetical protein